MSSDLLVVVGPTASGKSALGLEVASRLGAEIVSADAFAVYRGLDIGTDKPDQAARDRVPHHLLDIADPRKRFSAGEFLTAADRAIAAISGRGRPVVVVGGTHFYVRVLLLGLFPVPPREPELTARLAAEWEKAPGALHDRLREVDPEVADRIAPSDRQRVLRALEVFELTGVPLSQHWRSHRREPRYRALLVAPARPRRELYGKIESRVDSMFDGGLVDEVDGLLGSGVPADAHAFKAIGYREVVAYRQGQLGLEEALANTKTASRQLAKRQLTWLRMLREGPLNWVAPTEAGGVETVIGLWQDHVRGSTEP